MSFRVRKPDQKKKPTQVEQLKEQYRNRLNLETPKKDEEKKEEITIVDSFKVGDDTIVFDKKSGVWKVVS